MNNATSTKDCSKPAREFRESDWYGFGCSERFEGNANPLIRELSEDALAVIDQRGVYLIITREGEDGEDSETELSLDVRFKRQEAAWLFIDALPVNPAMDELEAMGFVCVG